MARRTRNAAPAAEVAETETEETGTGRNLRGPSPLHEAHAAYLVKTYGVKITPEQVYLAQSTRKEFRQTDGSGYEEALEAIEELREEKAAAKEQRAEERAAKQAEEATEPEAAPAPKKASKGTKAKAAAEPVAEEAAPVPARRRKAAAAAAPAETEAAPANGKAKRKAAF